MPYVYVKHSVENFDHWKAGFDANKPARQAGGGNDEEYVMRNADNPNEVVVILGWDDLGKARQFTQSPDLKEAMQKAGVTGPPEIIFLEAVG
jgi:heme-degrading monooxygenase HmoA